MDRWTEQGRGSWFLLRKRQGVDLDGEQLVGANSNVSFLSFTETIQKWWKYSWNGKRFKACLAAANGARLDIWGEERFAVQKASQLGNSTACGGTN